MNQYSYKINPNFSLQQFTDSVGQRLANFGYQVSLNPLSNDVTSSLNITKDQTDLNKILGLSTECNITFNKMNDVLVINHEDIWSNKILACAVGWFLCGIGLVTGLIGTYKQSNMAGEIQTQIMSVIAEINQYNNI